MSIVFKFGGICTGSVNNLNLSADLVKSSEFPLVVVLSAASGVTNRLRHILETSLSDQLIKSFILEIRQIHNNLLPDNEDGELYQNETITKLFVRLEKLLYGIHYTEEISPPVRDLIITFGERLIVQIFKKYLEQRLITSVIIDPEDILITNGVFSSSKVDLEKSKVEIQKKLIPLFKDAEIIIVAGFYGKYNNVITTLGNSGSDYTATSLAYCIDAKSVTIWKNVNGFMSGDPKIIPNAMTIPKLTYEEAAELANFGAKLLHPRAAYPAKIKSIPILMRHIEELDSVTEISNNVISDPKIKSVSYMENLAMIRVHVALNEQLKDALTMISKKIEELNVKITSITKSNSIISFLIPDLDAERTVENIETLGTTYIEKVTIQENMSLICVVGSSITLRSDLISEMFNSIISLGVKIEAIYTGASMNTYQLVVPHLDLNETIKTVHNLIFENYIE